MKKQDPLQNLAESDPGDDTLMRYRYQCTYAAIVSAGILLEESGIEEVFCEHHEDVLVKMETGVFIGIQVKTRNLDLGPFETDDSQMVNTIKRFLELELKFPNAFRNFVIATNVGFSSKKSFKGLRYVVDFCDKTELSSNKNFNKYVNDFITELKTDAKTVISVLKKIRLKPDIGNFEGIRHKLISKVGECLMGTSYTLAEISRVADDMISHHINASSLAFTSPLGDYFILSNSPKEQKIAEVVEGKRVTKKIIEGFINRHKTEEIQLHLKDELSSHNGLTIPVPKWFGRIQKSHLLNENSTLVACVTLTCVT
ncbi:dsDNA nuclease domain-containing protein [Lewinella sp. LCG006]|uniref:dsDNA nuclease domain-containing protein n=1 Tax=Lewinella sp. LCG006 TaxID=3231911 RepID=UPI0034606BDB